MRKNFKRRVLIQNEKLVSGRKLFGPADFVNLPDQMSDRLKNDFARSGRILLRFLLQTINAYTCMLIPTIILSLEHDGMIEVGDRVVHIKCSFQKIAKGGQLPS